jgi:hypothetical protein
MNYLGKLKRCYNCGDGLHLSFECDKPKTWNACYNCHEVGHKSNEWYSQFLASFCLFYCCIIITLHYSTKERREKKCYFCGQVGHIVAACPDRQKPPTSSSS